MHKLLKVHFPARNPGADRLIEHFLIVAATTIVVTRVFLGLTGYPELGAPGLHIAHMLWGGLLMLAALLMMYIFVGRKVKQAAALVGGAGLGLFIDEVGKFVTRDNNYFFQPSFAIMYGVFVLLFIIFRQLSLQVAARQKHTPVPSGVMEQLVTPGTTHAVLVAFCLSVLLQLLLSLRALDHLVDFWSVGWFASTLLAAILVMRGAWLYGRRRPVMPLHTLHAAVILSLLVVQFFSFYQDQLFAIFYVLISLGAYTTIDYHLRKAAVAAS